MPLDITHLPDLPHIPLLKAVAEELFADDDIRAIWLGGSMARGAGGAFSDIDLRLYVTPIAFSDTDLHGRDRARLRTSYRLDPCDVAGGTHHTGAVWG